MDGHQKVSSFLQLGPSERFERDYYITHTNRRRFTLAVILKILVGGAFFFFLGVGMVAGATQRPLPLTLGAIASLMPGLILLLYYCLRRLKISHGYASITNKRVVYYEFNEHPAENYQHVKSVHLDDITGVQFRLERSWFSKSFQMIIYTSKKGMVVGARSLMGWLNIFGTEKHLEPGPDALEYIQDMSGAIASRKFVPDETSAASAV